MPDVTVQDIFRRFYPEYLEHYVPSLMQRRAASAISCCKTPEMGANISICADCHTKQIHYNSCRNRHCPMCQSLATDKWMDLRQEDVLDVPYFHAVFTIPQQLYSLTYSNQKLLYDAMYHAVSATLFELAADKKHLGASIGFICILHTWGSKMNYHPHIHTILLGGGLDKDGRWKSKGSKFFFPVKVMSAVFKKHYLKELKVLHENQLLEYHGSAGVYRNHYRFKELLDSCYATEWISYIKEAFNGAQSVIRYLGRYTHRIAISNRRIISMDERTVTYSVKDYKNGGGWTSVTIPGVEFIRRFLMHVLPKGFVRIRHYGLLSCRCKNEKIILCRNQIGCEKYLSRIRGMDTAQTMMALYQVDIFKCPCCGGRLLPYALTKFHKRE